MSFESFIEYMYDSPYDYLSRRYLRDAENPMEIYDENEFRIRFRFTKNIVASFLLPLLFQNTGDSKRGLPIPPVIQMLAALRFYATGNFQIVCGDLHQISQSVVSKIVANVSKALALKIRRFIKFPDVPEQANVKIQFHRVAGFPGVIGCIDCTHIPIKNPNRQNGEVFRNRKGWFSINVQIVCGPRMEIYDIVARWPGSVHDSRIFNNSRCYMRFEEGEIAGLLIGDSGYAQSPYMYTLVHNPQSQPEFKYNRAHISTRNIIERFNGVWKRKFACLNRKLQNNLANTCNIIVACAVLYNISIETNQEMIEPLTNLAVVPVPHTGDTAQGSVIRAAFIARHFS
ncbi:putative nuclease HARBI1 [Leptidea sinapis]|uniref:putative nuclease HARBI1 n=1 Tax=Leptidea sinapis TaxID=189913 RepID=UPI0021C48BE6|nr:putative nuclease HARBI1 [Leptidea sinapis]XP_050685468.1 putative nuclease HARBI1 [Leptidea sinapis]